MASFNSKNRYLHQLSYEAHFKKIPHGMVIRHKCDNPSCFNPDHLILGTKKDNTKDMIKRGRASNWDDRNGKRFKLSQKQYEDIMESSESSYTLSKKYPVSSVQIRRLKSGSRGWSFNKKRY